MSRSYAPRSFSLLARARARFPRTLLALAFTVLMATGVASTCSAQPSEEDYQDDVSALGWTRAFDATHALLQRKYAFKDWKRIDWIRIGREMRPLIVEAERCGDQAAWFVALRRYSQRIPDGHVSVAAPPDDAIAVEARRAQVGGSLGLTIVKLDDGTIAADIVEPNGPAWRAGVRPGAAIAQWNDRPVAQALSHVDLVWAPTPSTREVRELEQLRFLVRAPIGAQVSLAFRNRGDAPRARRVTLTAVDDALALLEQTRLAVRPDTVIDQPILHSLLPGKIGYLRIRVLLDRDDSTFITSLDAAMRAFREARAQGIVIDLRGNPGGQDAYAALIGSYFHRKRRLYEQVSAFDIRTGALVSIPDLTLFVEPRPDVFEGGVVALIDAGTGSSAEGVAMLIAQRPRGAVVGRFATAGAFGLAGGSIELPGGYSLRYPMAQSVDAHGRVQIDSDARGRGGVQPDVPLAFTARHLEARQAGQDVDLAAALAILRWQWLFW